MRAVRIGGLLAATILSPISAAYAQEDEGVGEIVVTAQSRVTKLETTPLPVNVISGDLLSEQGIREVKQLTASVPGLTFNESPGGLAGISVRGIGSSASNQLLEQSVGLFVDGVYHPRSRQYRDAMFDLERIEVIKGSQGVLFGKNTSVGAISAISRRPGDEFAGYIAASRELQFGSNAAEGAIDLPFSSSAGLRISGFYNDDKGWVSNPYVGDDQPGNERWLARALFNWDVTDTFNVALKLQSSQSRVDGTAFEFVEHPNPATLQGLGVLDGGQRDYVTYLGPTALTGPVFEKQRSVDPSLTLTWEIGDGFALVATSGYSQYNFTAGFDTDLTPQPLIYSEFFETFEQFSQELRLISPAGRTLEYIVGATYIEHSDTFFTANNYRNFPAGPARLTGRTANRFVQDDQSYSVFGQVNWHVTDALTLQFGGRVGQETKEGVFNKAIPTNFGDVAAGNLINLAVPGTARGKIEDDSADFALTASYELTPSSVFYVNLGRGTKAGSFNNTTLTLAPTPSPFIVPAEDARTIEAGIKGRFLDGNAYASLSVFHIEVDKFQDSYYDTTARGFLVRSVDIKSQGVEFEGWWQATPWLNFYGNAAWNPTAELANGEPMQRAPEFTGAIGARVNSEISDALRFTADVNVVHSDTYLHQPIQAAGNAWSGAYDLVNARFAVKFVPADIEISLTGRNITDEVYRTFAFGAPLGGTAAPLNQPSTWMLGIRKTF